MRRLALIAVIAVGPLALVGCKKNIEDPQARLGPFVAEQWREQDAQGKLLKCFLLGKESNDPIRICGDGIASPDNQHYLFNAVTPAPGKFSEEGPVKSPGYYLLRKLSERRVEAWPLGRLGEHQWLGSGKALLAVETDDKSVTHIRLIDPANHADRIFDVPLAKSEGYISVMAPDESALLLIQKIGVELAILVHQPLTNPWIETLDIPNGKGVGAQRLWRRGNEVRAQHGVYKIDASIASNIEWKGEEPMYEGKPLGPFESPDERKRKPRPAATP